MEKHRYWEQMRYYNEVEKLQNIELKYASIKGGRGSLVEKNLDTQLNSDLLLKSISNEFDTAIVVSNDGDYVSAVSGAKTLGRRVELAVALVPPVGNNTSHIPSGGGFMTHFVTL